MSAVLPIIYPDLETAKAVVEDPQTANIPELHKAVFRWLEIFVKHSSRASKDSVDELKALGASDSDLAACLQLASTQVWLTSSADASGVGIDDSYVNFAPPLLQRDASFYRATQEVYADTERRTGPSAASGAAPHGWLAAPCSGESYEVAASAACSRYGMVPNLFAAVSASPDFYPRQQLALDLLERPQSGELSASMHALVRAATVALNQCDYFVPTVKALLELRSEREINYAELVPDPMAVASNDQERVVLAFADKLIRNPYKITEKDAMGFRAVGLNDVAYVDVYNTVAIQTSLDRLANCIGVLPDSRALLTLSKAY